MYPIMECSMFSATIFASIKIVSRIYKADTVHSPLSRTQVTGKNFANYLRVLVA